MPESKQKYVRKKQFLNCTSFTWADRCLLISSGKYFPWGWQIAKSLFPDFRVIFFSSQPIYLKMPTLLLCKTKNTKAWLSLYSAASFPQEQRCNLIAILSLFQWQLFRWAPHPIVPTAKTFTASTHDATSTVLNHRHFLRELSAQEMPLCGTDSNVDASLITRV